MPVKQSSYGQVPDPVENQDIASKKYVDDRIGIAEFDEFIIKNSVNQETTSLTYVDIDSITHTLSNVPNGKYILSVLITLEKTIINGITIATVQNSVILNENTFDVLQTNRVQQFLVQWMGNLDGTELKLQIKSETSGTITIRGTGNRKCSMTIMELMP